MKRINAAREQRDTLKKEVRALLDNHPGKLWTADQQKIYDEKVSEINALDAEITRLQAAADLDAEQRFDDAVADVATDRAKKAGNDVATAFRAFLSKDMKDFTPAEAAQFRNTMSTTVGSQGGFTVPSLISEQLFDFMRAFGTMRAVADVIRTADGKPMSFPTSDGTTETGEWIAQNTTATTSNPSFGTVSLNVFKASSRIVAVPIELMQDSVLNIEEFVLRRLATRLGRLGNTAFTVGTGTTQPDGVVPRSSVGRVGATGQTLTIVYGDLVDLVHSVDPAYRGPNSSFMTNDAMLRVLRRLVDTAGRPLWTPSYEQGIRIGVNNTSPQASGNSGFVGQQGVQVFDYLLGYPVYVNNDVPAPAANARSLLFGDFSYYKIRDAMDVTMFRFTDSVYTTLGQVGFLAWARMGGNLVDTNAIRHYAHSAT